LRVKTDDTEGVRTVISNSNGGTEEVKARILAGNKAYSSLQTVFRSKQIHRSMKLYKTLIQPELCYGKVTRTPAQMTVQMLCMFERKY